MNRLRGRVVLAFAPLLLAIVISVVLPYVSAAKPTFRLRADLGGILILLGGLVSLVALTYVWGRNKAARAQGREIRSLHRYALQAHQRFVQRLEHELKNPITAIRAGLANLNSPLPDGGQGLIIQEMEHQARRLSRLTSDLRKLADLEERPLERLPVDLNLLLQETVESIQAQPNYHDRQVQLVISQVPWPLPTLVGDYDLLALAFYNLLDNALKFSPANRPVEMRAIEDGPAVVVDVADCGTGIGEEDQQRLFEELYRGKNARGIEGSGLGLSLVQRIVVRHGGSVTFRSRTNSPHLPGEPEDKDDRAGTVFRVRLPLGK